MKDVVTFAKPLAQELAVLLSAEINGTTVYTSAFWKAQGLAFLKWVITRDVGVYVKQLVGEMVAATAEGIAEDSIPIAGWIMLGISVAVGVATLLETTLEIVESPWTYVNDLVFTATFQGKIYALDRATGATVWTYDAPGGMNGWPAVADDIIVWPVGLANPPRLVAFRLGANG